MTDFYQRYKYSSVEKEESIQRMVLKLLVNFLHCIKKIAQINNINIKLKKNSRRKERKNHFDLRLGQDFLVLTPKHDL